MLLARLPATALRLDFQQNAAVDALAGSKMYQAIVAEKAMIMTTTFSRKRILELKDPVRRYDAIVLQNPVRGTGFMVQAGMHPAYKCNLKKQ